MSGSQWGRLGHHVRIRRTQLHLSQSDLGPSDLTVRKLEQGLSGDLRRKTRNQIEHALRWRPGTIDKILDGTAPLADIVPTEPPEALLEHDVRAWRVGEHYGIHLYAVNPDGDDQPIGTAPTPEIAAQIVAEHALVATPYFDDEHRGGSWVSLLAQLQKQVYDLERRLDTS